MFNDFSKSTLANGSGTTELELCKDTVTDTERAAFACKTVLVTGANSGLGFDCCKQLAECGWGRIILACRNKERGEDAMKELETKAGKQIFELIVLDVESKMACVEAAKNLSGVLDCLVLNAGKMLPQSEALKPSPDGYTRNSAVHTLGPIVLIDAMLSFNKLNPDATVIYVSAEAARGIKVFGCAPASLPADKSEIDKFVDGKRRCEDGGNWDGFAEYATAKLLATMWISALARKHPQLRTFSVSPGSTRGTCFISELGMLSYVAPIMMNAISVLGLSQPLEHGTDRYVQAPENVVPCWTDSDLGWCPTSLRTDLPASRVEAFMRRCRTIQSGRSDHRRTSTLFLRMRQSKRWSFTRWKSMLAPTLGSEINHHDQRRRAHQACHWCGATGSLGLAWSEVTK